MPKIRNDQGMEKLLTGFPGFMFEMKIEHRAKDQ